MFGWSVVYVSASTVNCNAGQMPAHKVADGGIADYRGQFINQVMTTSIL